MFLPFLDFGIGQYCIIFKYNTIMQTYHLSISLQRSIKKLYIIKIDSFKKNLRMAKKIYLFSNPTIINKAAFPVIDAHNHLWGNWQVDKVLQTMNEHEGQKYLLLYCPDIVSLYPFCNSNDRFFSSYQLGFQRFMAHDHGANS
jgi:hypothetical protein